MNQNIHILQKTENFVISILDNLDDGFRFHNTQHTLDVRDAAQVIGRYEGLDNSELELLELAALFHDIGYSQTYDGHEEASISIAKDFLQKENYPESKINKVQHLISATKPSAVPEDLGQQILRDADMSHLGKKGYKKINNGLRREWNTKLDKSYSAEEWNEINIDFFENHQFLTASAKKLYNDRKFKNLETFLSNKNGNTMKESKKDKTKNNAINISGSKAAQMMFKTASRNHIDLTSIADNKANIMLSINSILVTIAIPMILPKVMENKKLAIPAACLMLTSVLTIIFATLATRPGKNIGKTSQEAIDKGKSNLFFFGNFYKMSYQEYNEGINKVLQNEQNLESSIVNDLYYLGLSLGKKFKLLRTTYTVFGIGMVVTVLSLIFALLN